MLLALAGTATRAHDTADLPTWFGFVLVLLILGLLYRGRDRW